MLLQKEPAAAAAPALLQKEPAAEPAAAALAKEPAAAAPALVQKEPAAPAEVILAEAGGPGKDEWKGKQNLEKVWVGKFGQLQSTQVGHRHQLRTRDTSYPLTALRMKLDRAWGQSWAWVWSKVG